MDTLMLEHACIRTLSRTCMKSPVFQAVKKNHALTHGCIHAQNMFVSCLLRIYTHSLSHIVVFDAHTQKYTVGTYHVNSFCLMCRVTFRHSGVESALSSFNYA